MNTPSLLRSVSRLALALLLVSVALGCAEGGPGPDPSVSVRVAALATEPTTLDGPGGTSLMVPAGATDEEVTITLTTPRTRRTAPAATTVVSGQVTLTPEGKTFLAPLELTIPITPSALPAGKTLDDVVVVRAPQGSGNDAFVPVPTRREGNAVVASTEHFSDFLAIVVDDPANGPFGECGDAMCVAAESCSVCPVDCGLCLPSNDTTPPTVLALASPTATTGVRGDATIVLTFDEPILPASVSAASIAIQGQGVGAVAGTFATSGATVTFTPDAPLRASTAYEVKLGTGVRDLAGNLSTQTFEATFTTGTSTPLSLAVPMNGATGVAQNAALTFVFDGSIDPQGIVAQQVDGPCLGSVQVSSDDFATCYGITPMVDTQTAQHGITLAGHPTPFAGNSTVRVRFGGTARDANGFSLGDAVGGYAVTIEQDTTPPSLLTRAPSFMQTDVPLDAVIVLTFSEPIAQASVNASTVRLTRASEPVTGTYVVTGNVVTFTPDAPLQAGANYSISVTNVLDLVGNSTQDTIFPSDFTTLGPPLMIASYPPQGGVGIHPNADVVITFSEPIEGSTLGLQPTDGPCSGTVQVFDGTICHTGTVDLDAGGTVVTVRTTELPTLANASVTFTAGVVGANGAPVDPSMATLAFRVSPTVDFAYVISPSLSSGGNLFSSGSLDGYCDLDLDGSRKAFVMTPTRYPCTTSWCGYPSTPEVQVPADWVLETNTTYVNETGDLLFTTDTAKPIPPYMTDLANPFGTSGSLEYFFGGHWDWTASSNNCMGFVDGTAGSTATRIDGALTTTASSGGWLIAGAVSCNSSFRTLCVDQVPGTLPPTHSIQP